MKINVNEPMPQVREMYPLFDLVDSLKGGTLKMREAGRKYLPQFPKEPDEVYKNRLATSVLYPAYAETLKNNIGRIFAKPVNPKDNTPEQIIKLLNSTDTEDRNFTAFAKDSATMALHYGLSHILVDTAPTRGDTLADGRPRPYLTLISPRNVLGWKRDDAGNLIQVRIMGDLEQEDGEFGIAIKPIVTVLESTRWRKYIENNGEWYVFDEGAFSIGKIPLTTIYANRTGFMTGEPPLLELAHLNIKHWQSQSDQDNILHIARVPLLAVFGGDNHTCENEASTQSIWQLPEGANMKYIEHSGAAIGAGQESLDKLEAQMRQCGAKLTYVAESTKTATQSREEATNNKSTLSSMAESARDGFNICLGYMADWLGLPEGGEVDMNTELDSNEGSAEEMTVISKMVANGSLSRQTEFEEARRRGLIDESRQWEEEQVRIDGDNTWGLTPE